MILVFFQNCLSPHQVPYIREVCHDERVEHVYLIAPRVDYMAREAMGWDSRQLLEGTPIQFLFRPSDEELEKILRNENVVALFTGIRADKDVFRWFRLSLGFSVKRGIITEAPLVYGNPLLCHCIRFLLQDYGYVKRIHYVFAIGSLAVRYYSFWNRQWKVFPFAYCTDGEDETLRTFPALQSCSARFLFVGSLDKRKNVGTVLRALLSLRDRNLSFDIIGDGPERKCLEDYVKGQYAQRIVFHGKMPMKQVYERMSQYNILILPSRYDGWGAVVNEALQRGLYVICSDKCGAKDLLEDERCGCVFKSGDSRQLAGILQQCSEHIAEIRADRQFRLDWAKRCISGKAIARYMVDCLSGNSVPKPWAKVL